MKSSSSGGGGEVHRRPGSKLIQSDIAQINQIDMIYGVEYVDENDEIFDRRSFDTPKFIEEQEEDI
jgi:hypothetical protein